MMFFDMGSTSTTVSVVGGAISNYSLEDLKIMLLSFSVLSEYKKVQVKEGGTMHIEPQLAVKGVGFDRTLGGLEMDMRMRNHLAKLFTVNLIYFAFQGYISLHEMIHFFSHLF